jgi:basic membrane protein A
MRGRVVVVVAAVVLLAATAGCADPPPQRFVGPDGTVVTVGETPAPVDDTTADDLDIAIVTSPLGAQDGAFNHSSFQGIEAFVATHPGSGMTAIHQSDVTEAVPAVTQAVAEHHVIVAPGFQFVGITQSARDHPDRAFILVDAFPADPLDPSGATTVAVDNVYAMQFREEELGFFGGVAAALETRTGAVAVLTGMPLPPDVHYQRGFEAGVSYANVHLGASAEAVSLPAYSGIDVTGENIGGNYVGDFNDPARGAAVARDLVANDVDIILDCAGPSGDSVFQVAKDMGGLLVIGCDVDRWEDGNHNGTNVVLTSVVKRMDQEVAEQLGAIAAGNFVGGNVLLGAADGATGYVAEDGHHQLTAATLAALAGVFDLVSTGAIIPPTGDPGTTDTPESFRGL